MAFRYSKTKKGTFTWTDDKNYRLVFEKPQVQAFDDYVLLHDEKSILYYYYTVTIYKREQYLTHGKWEVFNTVKTHDFPAVCSLKHIVNYLLHDKDITKGYQSYTFKRHNGEDIYNFSKTLTTGSHILLCDDTYELSKYYDTYSKKFSYDFSMGVRDELVRVSILTTDDIYSLYACVKDFIEYSIDVHNENVKLNSKSYSIADGHLYQYFVDGYSNTICERIKEILTSGDTFQRLTICEGGISAERSTDLYDATILEINRECLKVKGILEGGKVYTTVVTPQELGYTYARSVESYCSYSVEQIVESLLYSLNAPERKDFLTLPVSKLFDKYHYYIIEHYSMYSEQHHFLNALGESICTTEKHKHIIQLLTREIIENVKHSLLERT
jgi:hypothetical protein